MHKDISTNDTTYPATPWLLTSLIDSSGITRGKSVLFEQAESVALKGIGVPPNWSIFCVDNQIAWTPSISPVGDHRLKPDLSAIKKLDDSLYWAPAEVWLQSGERAFWCPRNLLRERYARLAALNIEVKVGGEIEFFLASDDSMASDFWNAYGVSGLLDYEPFVSDVITNFERLNLGIEQFHAEGGQRQFELSLTPAAPIEAMDKIALARITLGRIARKHGLRISFSPQPYADDAGNGAHLHFSFIQNGKALLAGTDEHIYGISHEGGAIIGGIVRYLPEMIPLLAPSVLSSERLQPGHWSGAYACWGKENREAAVRYCEANSGNPANAHIEVKCIDAAANPYIACATILSMALAGLEQKLPLPDEIEVIPASVSESERKQKKVIFLGGDQASALQRFEESTLAERMFPKEFLEALIAVRRHELKTYSQMDIKTITQRLRFAWSL